jgi:hypothetical protein
MDFQGRRSQGAGRKVPVGLERVLYAVALDEVFRVEFFEDREAALRARGVQLRTAELKVLRAVPEAHLRAAVAGLDTSPENLQRRGFLRAVAATAVTLGAAEALGGCSAKRPVHEGDPNPAATGASPRRPQADSGPPPDTPPTPPAADASYPGHPPPADLLARPCEDARYPGQLPRADVLLLPGESDLTLDGIRPD